ncbi:MAG: M13 family metallopeptidase [Saprospiraceae bacterium]|nr:M13 family metallopeptidase [Saprospiraceae bacterium]HMW38207.1 M13 family metallopeptidase [Saprospiraceae bacterium]HMX87402.1 M13 family metallopeptidase [Saprospiraceae bacterium]HMZ39229.1 M13 family metallopeptidase [Saprospiraceae bacterium]HNA63472.1 M13 family metallopeptidase [Saprospiraceae bacterium]
MKFFLSFTFSLMLIACKDNSSGNHKVFLDDILIENRDTTIHPGDDIYDYINGRWIRNNPIPSEEVSWSIAHLVINENFQKLRKICESAASASNLPDGSNMKKIGDYWAMAIDSQKCDQLGITPIKPFIHLIDSANTQEKLIEVIAALSSIGACTLVGNYVSQDDKNSDRSVLFFVQGGLGLPNRDYYFKNDERTVYIRNEYPKYIARMLEFIHSDSAESVAMSLAIMGFETNLANSSRKLEDLRDPYKNYNVMATDQLEKMAPEIKWRLFLEYSGLRSDSCIIRQPEYFTNLGRLICRTPFEVLRSYLKFHLIHTYASSLSAEIDKTKFNFYNRLIQGAEQQKPRWKRSLEATDDKLGELLGQEFVKNYFNDKAKKRYSELVETIRQVFREHLENLDWMSEETKKKAIVKLMAMTKKVGYPDHWKDLGTMKITRSSFCENEIEANRFWIKYNRLKLGKPVDRSEWDMTPQTYNAYYNPSNNEIVLPAAIFTVPARNDEQLDDALVYGYAAASTIGHEITHGFDDEGRQYDAKGNLSNWWTPEDEKRFKERSKKLVKQFNEYVLLDSLHINGQATLGENIADLGGVVLGLDAFKKTSQYREGKLISGLTPLQRYFMGYALGWLGHIRDASLASRLLTDVHSPAKYRVIGPFVNVNDFYNAFNIHEGDNMYRPDSLRVHIW